MPPAEFVRLMLHRLGFTPEQTTEIIAASPPRVLEHPRARLTTAARPHNASIGAAPQPAVITDHAHRDAASE